MLENTEGEIKMENPEKLTTWVQQSDEEKQNKTQHNMDTASLMLPKLYAKTIRYFVFVYWLALL
jgi:hypothetical protein